MAINSINTVTAAAAASTQTTTKSAEKTSETTKKAASSKTASGVIYEKSSDSRTDKASNKTTSKTDNAAIVAKLKADAEQRTAQLRSIVEQMMTKQGVAIGTADDMWKFLAKGDFTVSADVKAQAQADIADDGYWGVEQTSDRILDFAKALSGGDSEKADAMLEAFKKGFEQATKAWGDKLPDISQSVIITRMEGRTPVPSRESIQSFAAHQATMVVFLSTGLLEELSRELIAGGYTADTPAAIVYKATWPEEKTFVCTVGTLAETAKKNQITKTALMIIGNAVSQGNYRRSDLYNPAFTTEFREAEK